MSQKNFRFSLDINVALPIIPVYEKSVFEFFSVHCCLHRIRMGSWLRHLLLLLFADLRCRLYVMFHSRVMGRQMQPYEFLAVAAELVDKCSASPDLTIYLIVRDGELSVTASLKSIPAFDVIFKFYPRQRTEGLSAKEWHTVFTRMLNRYLVGRLH